MQELALRKPRFVRDKKFYRALLTIAVPITIQNIIVFATQMLDSLMLGKLGDVAMTSVNLANQPFFLFNLLCGGLGSGGAVLVAQYWGKGEIGPIKRILAMISRVAVLVALGLSACIWCFPEAIMRIYTMDAMVIEAGTEYLRIIAFSYLFFGFSCTYYTLIRSVECVKVAVGSNIVALVLNASLNYVLIFGKFGFPKMGVAGAAVATVIARIVECAIGIVYMLAVDRRLEMRLADFWKKDALLRRDLVRISIPIVTNELMWGVGMSLQTRLLGMMGTVAVSANAIVSLVQQLSTTLMFGVGSAVAVLIGKAIGEGNMQEARDRGFTMEVFSVVAGIFVAGIILLVRDPVVDFYNVSEQTKALARDMMYVAAGIGPFVSISIVGIGGMLRGGGDTKYSLFIEMIGLWGVAVPFGYFAAYVLHWPVIPVFIIMKFDEPTKCILLLLRLRTAKWIRNVTRDGLEDT